MITYLKEWMETLSILEKRMFFIVLAILSLGVLILGIRAWFRMFSIKVLHKFPFQQETVYLDFVKSGHYSIYLEGKKLSLITEGWQAEIISMKNGQTIEVTPIIFRIHQSGFSRGKVEMYNFHLEDSGRYSFQVIPGPKGWITGIRYGIQQVFQQNSELDNYRKLNICIAKGHSQLGKLLLFPQLFLAFVGLMGLIFSIVFAFNPLAFEKP